VNPELRGSAAHVFVRSLDAPELADDDRHHLVRVLRVGGHETVTVSDGCGRWSAARMSPGGLELQGDVHVEPPMTPVRVRTAIPKGERCEWMVHKLTEVGATEITLVHCSRSVVRWTDERAGRQLDRLRRIALQASMQARRVWLPEIDGPLPFAGAARGGVLADPSGVPLSTRPDAVLIGPEGGWSDDELAGGQARACLGPLVMRVETAAVAAAVLIGALPERG
jgi:16S rRNA (uracil1498-N3)-methyltransferase